MLDGFVLSHVENWRKDERNVDRYLPKYVLTYLFFTGNWTLLPYLHYHSRMYIKPYVCTCMYTYIYGWINTLIFCHSSSFPAPNFRFLMWSKMNHFSFNFFFVFTFSPPSFCLHRNYSYGQSLVVKPAYTCTSL